VSRQVELAYDTLFMESMKRRLSGELEVSKSVRYADVPKRAPVQLVRLRMLSTAVK
jgi:Protein CHAPERONE-LIKE PROTEIN OF POR1-like